MIIRNAELETVCGITSVLPDNDLFEIAFAGKSNVGKSSLINALLNRKGLARTSSSPGKTQTINFYRVKACAQSAKERELAQARMGADYIPPKDLDAYLVDLPGYGYAKASEEIKAKWGQLIERYLRGSKKLKLVLLLVDIRHKPSENDRMMYDWILSTGYAPVIAATKLDKIKRSQVNTQVKEIRQGLHARPETKIIPFSAETKQGRDEIWKLIEEIIDTANTD